MAKHINRGWPTTLENAAQPIGVVLGGNLRQNSEPKITHGSSLRQKGRRVLSPEEGRRAWARYQSRIGDLAGPDTGSVADEIGTASADIITEAAVKVVARNRTLW